jgi:hypothetical protein
MSSKALFFVVAGAGDAKYYTAPETHWIDLK